MQGYNHRVWVFKGVLIWITRISIGYIIYRLIDRWTVKFCCYCGYRSRQVFVSFPCHPHLQLQEVCPALLPLMNSIEELFVILVVLLQALELSVMQTQQLFSKIL